MGKSPKPELYWIIELQEPFQIFNNQISDENEEEKIGGRTSLSSRLPE